MLKIIGKSKEKFRGKMRRRLEKKWENKPKENQKIRKRKKRE